jgi:hypothetical protein
VSDSVTLPSSKTTFFLLVSCVALLLGVNVLMMVYKAHFYIGNDFVTFYETGKAYLMHQMLYQPETWINYFHSRISIIQPNVIQQFSENLNPPFFSIIFSIFSHSTYGEGFIYFTIVNMLIGLLGLFIFYEDFHLVTFSSYRFLWLMLFFFGFYPTYMNLSYAQFGMVTFLLVVLLRRFTLRKQAVALGVTLGFACSVKLFFFIFLGYYFLLRQWQVLLIAMLVFFSIQGLGVYCCGIASYNAYFHVLQSIDWQAASDNGSISGVLSRFLGGGETVNLSVWQLGYLRKILFSLSALVIVGHIIGMVLNDKDHLQKGLLSELHFHVVLVAMLLLSPLGWRYYFSFYILTGIFLLSYLERRSQAFGLFLCVLPAIVFISMPGVIVSRQYIIPFREMISNYSFAFYGLLFLYISLMVIRRDILKQGAFLQVPQPFSETQKLCLLASVIFSFLGVVIIIPSIYAFWQLG